MLRDIIVNPEYLKAIWGTTEPTLAEVDLTDICFQSHGVYVEIGFYVQNYPLNPPRKWTDAGFDSVLIKLRLLQPMIELAEGMWGEYKKATIDIERVENRVQLKIAAKDFSMVLAGQFLHLSHQEGYYKTTIESPKSSI